MSHLKENNITYYKHFKRSMKFSGQSLKASLCFFVHGIFPDVAKYKGSKIINQMKF